MWDIIRDKSEEVPDFEDTTAQNLNEDESEKQTTEDEQEGILAPILEENADQEPPLENGEKRTAQLKPDKGKERPPENRKDHTAIQTPDKGRGKERGQDDPQPNKGNHKAYKEFSERDRKLKEMWAWEEERLEELPTGPPNPGETACLLEIQPLVEDRGFDPKVARKGKDAEAQEEDLQTAPAEEVLERPVFDDDNISHNIEWMKAEVDEEKIEAIELSLLDDESEGG